MAKTVASLSVSINARTKGLRRGLKQAQGQVATFASQVASLTAKIAGIGTGLAAIGGGAVAFGTKRAMNSLSDLAKVSDKLSGIEPTFLIALRDAAQESGVEVKTFDMGLQRMLRRIQEASQGKGEAQGVLKDLRLDAAALVEMAPEKQFAAIAKAMVKAKDDGLDLSRAIKLFDSEGVALVNTLRLIDEQGLDKFVQEVQRSGRAVTRDQLRPIESVEDRLGRLGDRISGIFTQLAVAVSGPLEKQLKALEDFLNKPAQVKAIGEAFQSMAKGIADAAKSLDGFLKNWKSIKAEAESVTGRKFDQLEQAVSGTTSGFRAAGNLAGGVAASIDTFATDPTESGRARAKAILGETLNDTVDILKRGFDDVKEAATGAAEDIASVVRRFRGEGSAKSSAGKVFRFERGDGTPIPFGPALGAPANSNEAVNELKEQTKILRNLDRGTNPASLPKGTMVLIAG